MVRTVAAAGGAEGAGACARWPVGSGAVRGVCGGTAGAGGGGRKGCGAHPDEHFVARADASHRLCRRRRGGRCR